MQYSIIENLLKEKIGLDPASIGSSSITRVIRRRFAESGHGDLDKYIEALMSSEQEMKALIEAIVVSETWFFRDSRPFMLFNDYVKEYWLSQNKGSRGALRILSIPCSTGEEPYSLAMILCDLNYSSNCYQIDAVDISSAAIAHARRCVYRENSFRGDEMDFRYRYFVKENKDYKLDSRICNMVNFYQGNLLDSKSFPVRGPYHVIFCRNLLIYFDRSDQERAIAILHKMLASDGILFIGHAEANQVLNGWFSPLKSRGAFAYRKSVKENPLPKKSPEEKNKSRRNHNGNARALSAATHALPALKHRPFGAYIMEQKPLFTADISGQLEYIRRLADEGRLSEASLLCEQYLMDHPNCATAYYLLGVLYDAAGDINRAADMFRKAIYLDPDHHEALIHLSLYAERSGNKSASKNLKRRAQRAAERHKSSIK